MSKQRIGVTLLVISLISVLRTAPARAQDGGWSEPLQLSSGAGRASEAYLVADQYGYVHCFWVETLFENQNRVIKYARFDGTTWTKPNDIYLTVHGITNVSPVVDQYGTLHIVWAEGFYGPAYYSYAPANNALSAQSWAKPLRINIPAGIVRFRVDSKDVFHILYVNRTVEDLGVYYVRSEDRGITWSNPVLLDPNIPPEHTPEDPNFELDENDGLHAVWNYGSLHIGDTESASLRYTHSFDGGHTWSSPFVVDQEGNGDGQNGAASGPRMIVQGHTVHVIWAAGQFLYRHHSFSTDAGLTWSAPAQIFGELQGQAWDGLAVDRAGRVHFFGQIRYPMGIYHAYWDKDRWSKPSMIYLVSADGATIGDRVHAHYTLPVVRGGNQLVVTFTDGPADPNRRLFVMYRTLDDISPLENVPTPVLMATPVPISTPTPGSPTPMPAWTPTAPSLESLTAQPLGSVPAPDHAIELALVPTLLILVGTLIFQLQKRKP